MGSFFPEGLRVLVVDDDATCLKIIGRMLQHCKYSGKNKEEAIDESHQQFPLSVLQKVLDFLPAVLPYTSSESFAITSCNQPSDALSLLRSQRGEFDLVITDVKMPGMDGFKLLEHIELELDIPVIMMSADAEKDTMVKGLTKGACFYLVKPVRMDQVMTIWQHVIRRNQGKLKDNEQAGTIEDNETRRSIPVIKEEVAQNNIRGEDDGEEGEEEVGCTSVTEGNWKPSRRRRKVVKEEQDSADRIDDDDKRKKPRIMWNSELHDQFIVAVNRIGIDRAVPKKILEIMKCPGLSRENVASHLQKYRLYIKKVQEANLYNAMGAKPPNPVPSRSIFGHIPRQVLQQHSSFPQQHTLPLLQTPPPPPPPFGLQTPYGAAMAAMSIPPVNQILSNPFLRFHPPQLLNNQLMNNPNNLFGFHHHHLLQQQQQQQLISASLPMNGFPARFRNDQFLNIGNGGMAVNSDIGNGSLEEEEGRGRDEPLPDFNPSDFIDMMGDFGGQNCRPTEVVGDSGPCTETRIHEGGSNNHQFRSEDENLSDVLQGFMCSGNGDLGDLFKKKDDENDDTVDGKFVNNVNM